MDPGLASTRRRTFSARAALVAPWHTARGTTLIEALVALALLALLATGIVSAFQTAGRSYRRTISASNISWDVASAQSFVRRVVEAAIPVTPSSGVGTPHYGLEGSAQDLFVSAAATQSITSHGPLRFEFLLLPRADGLANWVVRSHADGDDRGASPVSGSRPLVHEEVLLEGVKSIRVRYLEPSDLEVNLGDSATRWHDTWRGHTRPPLLVSISVRFPASDQRVWPALFAIPRATERAGCEFDVVSQACREITQ